MKNVIVSLLISMLIASTVAMMAMEGLASKGENGKENQLEKIVFIHYKKDHAKPVDKSKQTKCYKLLPAKVSWKETPISYVINPQNPFNLDESLILSAVSSAAEEWDAHTSRELMEDQYTIDYSVAAGIQDYRNVVAFGNYQEEGVIAITTIWYNPATKAIVEFDIMLDTDWVWGNADSNNDGIVDNPLVMDIQNIATHEFGHAIGLGDVYNYECSEVTMYGYSDYGEIKKRSLEQPDITALQTLYGN